QDWQATDRLKSVSVDGCNWAHPEDIAARQIVLPQRFLAPAMIQRFAEKFRWDARNGLVEAPRGCILWIVPEGDAQGEWLHANADRLLDETLDSAPLPIVLAIPETPRPHFDASVLRELELKALTLDERSRFGSEIVQDAEKRFAAAIDQELERLRAESR